MQCLPLKIKLYLQGNYIFTVMRQNSPKWKEHILDSLTDGKREVYFSRLWFLFCFKVVFLFPSAFLLPCFPACLNVIQDSFSFALTLFSYQHLFPPSTAMLSPRSLLQNAPLLSCKQKHLRQYVSTDYHLHMPFCGQLWLVNASGN